MSAFAPAVAVVLRHEGGYVDDPDDLGGETNFGISTKFIREQGITAEELGLPNLEPGALKALKIETASDLYAKYFWYRWGYSKIDDQTCATKVFDCAVNIGPMRAATLSQQAAIVCGQWLVVDGILGPDTAAAISACSRAQFLQSMADEMADYYRALVRKRPRNAKFLRQWLVRAAWPGLTVKAETK